MRFLLHASKKARNVSRSCAVMRAATRNTSPSENLTKSWGQQCSPNCGCVIRFESTMNENNTIVSASYQAKTILTFTENGQRLAHFTTHGTKPLVKECSCNTLHKLSQQVVHYLEGKRVDQVSNSLSGTSAAVVYACLKTQDLPTRHASCFHLVQQALVGMVCGYLPKAPSQQSYQEYLYERYALYAVNEEEAYGVDENCGISTGAALHIFDMNNDGTTVEEEETEQEKEEKDKTPKRLTWEAYVDELYHQHDDKIGLEWSA